MNDINGMMGGWMESIKTRGGRQMHLLHLPLQMAQFTHNYYDFISFYFTFFITTITKQVAKIHLYKYYKRRMHIMAITHPFQNGYFHPGQWDTIL